MTCVTITITPTTYGQTLVCVGSHHLPNDLCAYVALRQPPPDCNNIGPSPWCSGILGRAARRHFISLYHFVNACINPSPTALTGLLQAKTAQWHRYRQSQASVERMMSNPMKTPSLSFKARGGDSGRAGPDSDL